MRPSSVLLLAVLGLGSTLLSGCSTTLVQYLPQGEVTTCDAGWPGLWKGSAPGSEAGESGWMEISANCQQLTFTDSEKTSVEKKRLTLVTAETGQYLSITDAEGKPECLGENNTDCGLPVVRYERDGDVITLYSPNHERVSRAIANDGVAGLTLTDPIKTAATAATQVAKPKYRNLITGTPEQIAQILADHPEFFDAEPWLVMTRETTDTRPKHPEVSK